jgi:hypothetical protein
MQFYQFYRNIVMIVELCAIAELGLRRKNNITCFYSRSIFYVLHLFYAANERELNKNKKNLIQRGKYKANQKGATNYVITRMHTHIHHITLG